MSEMNCKQYRAVIEGSDSAAVNSTARAESHAAACAECRGFGDEQAALRGLVAGLARVDAPPDFEFRLRARMSAADSARKRSRPQNLLSRAVWLAAAGCLALAAVLALQTRNSRTPDARETAGSAEAAKSSANPAANAVADAGPRKETIETAGEMTTGEQAGAPAELNAAAVTRRRAKAATPPAVASAARQAQRRPALAAAPPSREAVASSAERSPRMETSTSSMLGSPIIVSTAIPLPVSAGERPLQVLFKDTQGAARVVNVDPVTFGSNEPAARPTNVNFTKATKKQGVW